MTQRRRDRALLSGFDLQERQRQPLALLGERPRCRRQALALGEGTFEGLQTFAGDARLLT